MNAATQHPSSLAGDPPLDQLTLDAATEAAILDTADALGIAADDVNVLELVAMLGWA